MEHISLGELELKGLIPFFKNNGQQVRIKEKEIRALPYPPTGDIHHRFDFLEEVCSEGGIVVVISTGKEFLVTEAKSHKTQGVFISQRVQVVPKQDQKVDEEDQSTDQK